MSAAPFDRRVVCITRHRHGNWLRGLRGNSRAYIVRDGLYCFSQRGGIEFADERITFELTGDRDFRQSAGFTFGSFRDYIDNDSLDVYTGLRSQFQWPRIADQRREILRRAVQSRDEFRQRFPLILRLIIAVQALAQKRGVQFESVELVLEIVNDLQRRAAQTFERLGIGDLCWCRLHSRTVNLSDKVYEMTSVVLRFCVAFQFDRIPNVTNRMLVMRNFRRGPLNVGINLL